MVGFGEWLFIEAGEPWANLHLLTWGDENPKTAKSNKSGLTHPETGKSFYTAVLHLSPANESGFQCCAWHTTGCAQSCLHYTGDPQRMGGKLKGRFSKTLFLAKRPDDFLRQLYKEIEEFRQLAQRDGRHLSIRLNATSDIPWEASKYSIKDGIGKQLVRQVMHHFPDVFFYDYTKSPGRMDNFLSGRNFPRNYHLTYSRSEHATSPMIADGILERGGNVAIVFNVHRRHPLPNFWLSRTGHKFPIINGDLHDLRILDPKGVVVGLRAKGDALWDKSGFVVQPEDEHLQSPENRRWVEQALRWRDLRWRRYLDNRRRTIAYNRQAEKPERVPGGPGWHRRRAMRLRKSHGKQREKLLQSYGDYISQNPSREGLPVADIPFRLSLPSVGEHMSFKDFIESDLDFPVQTMLGGMEDMVDDSDVKEIHIDDIGNDWDTFHGRRGKHSQIRARHLAKLMNRSRLNPGREYAIVFKPEPGGVGGYWIVSRKGN